MERRKLAPRVDDSDEENDTLVIARLVPVSRDSQDAFSRTLENTQLSDFHRGFICAKRIPPKDPTNSDAESRDAGYDSDRPSQPVNDSQLWAGHYVLSFDRLGDVKTTIGWRIGRGTSKLKNRGVDLLVVGPGEYSYGIDVVHALIQFHPESGVLLLRGVSEIEPVRYYLDRTLLLYAKDKHVLYQAENRFSLGKLDFKLEYESLDDLQYSKYVTVRNKSLQEAGHGNPHPRLIAVPRKPHVKIDNLILHDNLSSGAFGFVCAAVDGLTGVPLALKEVWIRNSSMARENDFVTECAVSTAFHVCDRDQLCV